MTRALRRGGRQAAAALFVIALLSLLQAPPASAEWKEQWWFRTIDVKKAWPTTKGAGVTVAVIDSGVDATLGDLKGRVLPGVDLSGAHTDGRSDPGDACDRLGCYSHGTDMALLIAGTGRGSGFQGIAPEAKVLPVKIQRKTGVQASSTAIAAGVRWAVDHAAKIINISEGHPGRCDPGQRAALQYAYQHDVIVVTAAGNSGVSFVASPANCPGALAVSAAEQVPDKQPITLWSGSNYGPEIAFTASGADLPQELLSGTKVTGANGTSQAAAITSGVLALVRARFPTLSARDVVTRALWSVHTGVGKDPDGHRINDRIGYGEVLPYYAVTGNVPADFPNPIYDAWQREFATAPSSPAPSTSASTSPPAGSTATGPGSAPSPERTGSGSGSSSSSGVVIAAIAGGVVVLVGGGLLLARRGRGRATP